MNVVLSAWSLYVARSSSDNAVTEIRAGSGADSCSERVASAQLVTKNTAYHTTGQAVRGRCIGLILRLRGVIDRSGLRIVSNNLANNRPRRRIISDHLTDNGPWRRIVSHYITIIHSIGVVVMVVLPSMIMMPVMITC